MALNVKLRTNDDYERQNENATLNAKLKNGSKCQTEGAALNTKQKEDAMALDVEMKIRL